MKETIVIPATYTALCRVMDANPKLHDDFKDATKGMIRVIISENKEVFTGNHTTYELKFILSRLSNRTVELIFDI